MARVSAFPSLSACVKCSTPRLSSNRCLSAGQLCGCFSRASMALILLFESVPQAPDAQRSTCRWRNSPWSLGNLIFERALPEKIERLLRVERGVESPLPKSQRATMRCPDCNTTHQTSPDQLTLISPARERKSDAKQTFNAAIDCGFNRWTQQIDEIVGLVSRNSVSSSAVR